jgi:hypothetical protein
MIRKFIFLCLVSVVGGAALSLNAQTAGPAPTPTAAEGFYHQAMNAYLDGNYDQAIVFTAQSLQADPNFDKSKNLLTVLTTEKENEGKTVIWLAGKPVVVAAPRVPLPVDESGIEESFRKLQARFNNYADAQARKNNQTDGQIQVIQELVQSSTSNGYEDLKKSQGELYKELQKDEADRSQDLRFLYILCSLSVLFSVAAIWKKNRGGAKA